MGIDDALAAGAVGPEQFAQLEQRVMHLENARLSDGGALTNNYTINENGEVEPLEAGLSEAEVIEIILEVLGLELLGDMVAADENGLPTAFEVGEDGDVLTADSGSGVGVSWVPPELAPTEIVEGVFQHGPSKSASGIGTLEYKYVAPPGASSLVVVAMALGGVIPNVKKDGAAADETIDASATASRRVRCFIFNEPTSGTVEQIVTKETAFSAIQIFTMVGRTFDASGLKTLIDENNDQSMSPVVKATGENPICLGLTTRTGAAQPTQRPGQLRGQGNGVSGETFPYFEFVTLPLIGHSVEESFTWEWGANSGEASTDSAAALLVAFS